MPDDRTTGRPMADNTVSVTTATARAGTDRAQQGAEAAKRRQAQDMGQFNELVEEAARVSQEFTNRATQNAQALIGLTEASVSGWQQAVSELSQQMQQAIEHQSRVFNAALQVCRPEQLFDLHSDFVTERFQAQLATSARLAQIAAALATQAAQRL
jgi:hypothetical protein